MLYLITGANGAGKTLNTLKWVQERALKENRPVAHNGRFEPVPGSEIANWKAIDFQKWQDEPDGTIFVVDECHNDLPTRPSSAIPPDYVRMLAEHRRRGFDFYLISQHPQNVDAFVRRLIGSPGWHRHLKRTFGADLVSVLEWSAVNSNCEKPGSGKSGTVSMQPFPKEVYSWYRSASLHTGKKKIPKVVYFLAFAALAIPAALYGTYSMLMKRTQAPVAASVAAKPAASASSPVAVTVANSGLFSADDYVTVRVPRLASLPHTAPIYDEVTKPRQAPYPAACVQMGKRCTCYSQQATILHVEFNVCVQIVEKGFFVEWQEPPTHEQRERPRPEPVANIAPPVVDQPVAVPDAPPVVRSGTRSQWARQLAARNQSVQSMAR